MSPTISGRWVSILWGSTGRGFGQTTTLAADPVARLECAGAGLRLGGGVTMRQALLALAASVVMIGGALAGPLQDGFAASQRGDYTTALSLWFPLAQRGNPDAQFGIGMLYYRGHGVPQSYAEAMRWMLQAASEDHYFAQFTLGSMYEHGIGVPEDLAQAHMWFDLAAVRAGRAQFRTFAARERDHVAALMTAAQIAEAQRLAREWVAAHPRVQ